MSPTLNGSSTIRRFEGSDAIEIRDGTTFDFYTGLPQLVILITALAPWVPETLQVNNMLLIAFLIIRVNGLSCIDQILLCCTLQMVPDHKWLAFLIAAHTEAQYTTSKAQVLWNSISQCDCHLTLTSGMCAPDQGSGNETNIFFCIGRWLSSYLTPAKYVMWVTVSVWYIDQVSSSATISVSGTASISGIASSISVSGTASISV